MKKFSFIFIATAAIDIFSRRQYKDYEDKIEDDLNIEIN